MKTCSPFTFLLICGVVVLNSCQKESLPVLYDVQHALMEIGKALPEDTGPWH